MTPQEVQERLKLNQLKDKIWSIVPSCATSGEGLFEGLVRLVLDCRDPADICRVGSQTTSRINLNGRSNELQDLSFFDVSMYNTTCFFIASF